MSRIAVRQQKGNPLNYNYYHIYELSTPSIHSPHNIYLLMYVVFASAFPIWEERVFYIRKKPFIRSTVNNMSCKDDERE